MWQGRQQLPPWMMGAWHDQKKERMLNRFARELTLTDSQKVQVKKILDSTAAQMQGMRTEARPKFQTIRTEMSQGIRALLTQEQRKRFEATEAEWNAHKRRWDASQSP